MAKRKTAPLELQIRCLPGVATFPGVAVRKPMLVGFAPAEQLKAVSSAPAFAEADSNRSLARMLQHLPADEWQRPLDKQRVRLMTAFFDGGPNLMPNPVLLAVNPDRAADITIAHDGGDIRVVRVPLPAGAAAAAPLWILDGQHRINALGSSKQRTNPIPFVLLHEEGGNYTPSDYAAIFAQVTTRAEPLEEPHNTWLEYSFDLGTFEPPGGASRKSSFETVVWLGSDERVHGTRTKNRFAGNIRFNPRNPPPPASVGLDGKQGVFAFQAHEFAEIIFEDYFKKPPAHALVPRDLAGQIALAVDALAAVVPGPHVDVAFFKSGNQYIHQAFIAGVLTQLRTHGKPASWESLLRTLTFDKGGWNFAGRQITTGGQHGSRSKRAALSVFREAFEIGGVPGGATLSSYLMGDLGTRIELSFMAVGAAPRSQTITNQSALPLVGYLKKGVTLRVTASRNVGHWWMHVSTRGTDYWKELTRGVQRRQGFILDALAEDLAKQGTSGRVVITLFYEPYGGQERKTDISFSD